MIKEIIKDVMFLGQKSVIADKNDLHIANDLLDTLKANESICVGLAANMIGVKKRIIVFNNGFVNIVMFNPIIKNKAKPYKIKESCLSLTGERETTRYELIEVEYQDIKFQKQKNQFTGFIAQIIQHEIDHCNGIVI